jgi:hypothetical protein
MVTTTDLPLWLTLTFVPNGSERWAAVSEFWLNLCPDAVSLPWNPGPYQEAEQEVFVCAVGDERMRAATATLTISVSFKG